MFSKQSILSAAGRFLPQEKIQLLSQAYDFADKITNITNDPAEIIKKAGITKQDLDRARKLLNNPIAGFFFGEKKQSIIDGLNKAEMFFNEQINSLSEQAPVSELEQLQANLARLK